MSKNHSNSSQYKWKEDAVVVKDICFDCGSSDSIHYHHVVPESRGGTRTIPLCIVCHGKVHNKNFLEMKELSMIGIKKAKERGVRFGNPNGFGEYQKLGVNKIKENALTNEANVKAMEIIYPAREQNMTLQQIADKLNSLGYKTRRGKQFDPTAVKRIYEKYSK